MKASKIRPWRDRDICWLVAAMLAVGMFLGVALSCFLFNISAAAEEEAGTECWIFCQPGSEVIIRERPGRRAPVAGATINGRRMLTDGKTRDGWVHMIDVSNEAGEGWVYGGYVVYEEPIQMDVEAVVKGGRRVACRSCVGGKRKAWAAAGTMVTVYAMADGWAVTDHGYIRCQYLEVP